MTLTEYQSLQDAIVETVREFFDCVEVNPGANLQSVIFAAFGQRADELLQELRGLSKRMEVEEG